MRTSEDFASDRVFESTDELLAAGVSAIIGAPTSGVTLSIIDQVVASGTVLFSPTNTVGVLTAYPDDGLYFRTGTPDSLQARALAELIVADGVRRLGVISRDDAIGRAFAERLLAEVQALGIAAGDILVLTYSSSTDFPGIVETLVDFEPDGIAVLGFGESLEAIGLLNQAGIGPQRRSSP